MKVIKGLLVTILLIGLCFFGIALGVRFGLQRFEAAQNSITNVPRENIVSNILQNNTDIYYQNILTNEATEETTISAQPLNLTGKWNTVSAVDTSNWITIENLSDIFGSSYSSYGSYLQLNPDNTFLDCIYPITSGEFSTEGTYDIQNDYYSLGDMVVILNYSDGRKNIFKVIYEEENIPLLMQDVSNGEPYQFNLEK